MSAKVVCGAVAVAVTAVLILIIALVWASLGKLESTEVGIQYNTFLKTLDDEPFYEGLHLGPPGYSFIKFPSVFKTLSFSRISCRNLDGVTIDISVSFQYRVIPSDLSPVITQFQDEDGYSIILNNVGSSAVHDTCSIFNTEQLQSERGRFQQELVQRLVEKFEQLSCDVTDLQVNDITRPRDYENAVKAKEAAREDIEVAYNERPRQITEAQTTKREAETEAEIIANEAATEARIITLRADAEGKAILNDYKQEAGSYKSLKEANELDNESFIAYMAIRAIANSKNPVNVAMKSPAKTSYNLDN